MPKLIRFKWIFDPQVSCVDFTHAQVPTPLILHDRIRVFFSGRVNAQSNIYSIDIEPPPSFKPIKDSIKLLLSPNVNKGTFDDEGVMPSCFVQNGDEILLFYSGWNSRNTVPYHNSTGIAVYDPKNNQLARKYQGPVLERNYLHPYLAVTPTIWKDGDLWRSLYISGVDWKWGTDRYEPIYVIKEAYSDDLTNWSRPFDQVINSNFEFECFSNPSIFCADKEEQHILFCSRSGFDFRTNSDNSYKMGYAKRFKGKYYRKSIEFDGGLMVEDNLMQAYPHFFEWENEIFVLYNGNGFGKTGFGVAKFQGEEL